jgi:hypothetical protein
VIPLALTTGDVILIVIIVVPPVALLTFILGAGNALNQIGKGQFAVQFEDDLPKRISDSDSEGSSEVREAEIRQLLEAKAYRQRSRGEDPVDIEDELGKLLEQQAPSELGSDKQLLEEVRQIVVARNERRARQGKEPLDVDAEIERQLRDLEGLGQ